MNSEGGDAVRPYDSFLVMRRLHYRRHQPADADTVRTHPNRLFAPPYVNIGELKGFGIFGAQRKNIANFYRIAHSYSALAAPVTFAASIAFIALSQPRYLFVLGITAFFAVKYSVFAGFGQHLKFMGIAHCKISTAGNRVIGF